jgi:hypothetical protein
MRIKTLVAGVLVAALALTGAPINSVRGANAYTAEVISSNVTVKAGETMTIKQDAPVEITSGGSLTVESGGTLILEYGATLTNNGSFVIKQGGYVSVLDNASIVSKEESVTVDGIINITGILDGSVSGTGRVYTVMGMEITTVNDGVYVNSIPVKKGKYMTGKIAFCGLSPETGAEKEPNDWLGEMGIITDSVEQINSSLYGFDQDQIITRRIGNQGKYFTLDKLSYENNAGNIGKLVTSMLGSYVDTDGTEYWALRKLDNIGDKVFVRWGERWPGQACSYDETTGIFIMDERFDADFKGVWKGINDPDPEPDPEVTPDKTIKVGDSVKLTVKKKVSKVEVSDTTIATAKAKKKKVIVTGFSAGTVTITAYNKKGKEVGSWVVKVE